MGILSKISGIFKAEFKLTSAYRFEMAVTVIVAPISLLVFYFLWKAIYAYSGMDIIRGFTLAQLITYYVITWIIGIFTYTHIANLLRHEVRVGGIVRGMLKPINYIWFHFFTTLGNRIYAVVIEIIPILIIAFFFFKVKLSLIYLFPFLISFVFALILVYLITALVGMTAFWLVRNRGVLKLNRILGHFLAGGLMPLTFFPIWFQNLSYFLPFQYFNFIPANIWLGKYTATQILQFLGLQVVWILIFYFICAFVWRSAMKKVAAVGV